MANTIQEHWAGVDWGDREHAVCVVAAQGQVIQRFSAPHTAEGVETITDTLRATTLADELRTLQRGIDEHRRRIQGLFARHPQSSILASLPGAGPKLAPRLLCIFDACEERYEGAQGVCELAGTVPVTKQSGRSITVKFCWACRKSYRDTMHQYAWVSMRRCQWARVFYQNCRKAGQHRALALRNLASKWSKIIYRMCCENAPYDEQRYLDALRRGNSPLAAGLEGQNSLHNSTEKNSHPLTSSHKRSPNRRECVSVLWK